MASISTIEYNLDNIVIGDTFRMIKSNVVSEDGSKGKEENSFYNIRDKYETDNEISGLLSGNLNLNYTYFMKSKNNLKINSSYSQDFISNIEENLRKEKSNRISNSLFYDKEIQNLIGNDFIQLKNNFYFLNSNKFSNSFDNIISGKYEFFPTPVPTPNEPDRTILGMISSYISKNYNNEFYDNSLKFVNDKSIPIYDLNYKALNDIDVLKFQNSGMVDSIIFHIDNIINSEKYNGFEFKKLSEIKNKILYSSKLNKKSEYDYDSIIISPIVEEYLESSDLLDEIFDFIFINLSLDSFYRLLIPVGKINTIFNDITSIYSSTTDFEDYTYYINVDNIQNLNNNINFNYFYLKNLKNPFNEYDYQINDINENLTCHTNAYSLSSAILYKILNFIDSSLNELKNYINENHAGVISGQYIKEHDLIPLMVEDSRKRYNNWSTVTISAGIEREGTWIRYKAFNNYFKDYFNKNLTDEPYLITNKEVKDFWNDQIYSFENEYKNEMFDDQSLSSYYLSGLTIFSEINNQISIYLNGIYDENSEVKVKDDEFILEDTVYLIFNNLFSMSNTQTLLKEIYTPSLNKLLALSILNKNDINDRKTASEESWYVEKYKDRFSIKLNDYKNSFDYYYNHENIMKKDGYIYGFRKYNFINKSFTDKLFTTYNYYTSIDYNFLIKHNLFDSIEIENMSTNNLLFNQNHLNFSNFSLSSLELNSSKNELYYDINANEICKCINSNKNKEFLSYIAMLVELRKYEFVDFIEGDFKYKEADVSKSNVYSIELKNSNLNYQLYDYDEMVAIIKLNRNEIDTTGFKTNPELFMNIVHEIGYKEILDITMNEDIEMLKKIGFIIPNRSYKFYKAKNSKNEDINTDIYTKMELRKQLEKAIRKSISRYAPINTTLWKIKYTGL